MKNDVNTKKFLVIRRFGSNDNSDFFGHNMGSNGKLMNTSIPSPGLVFILTSPP